MPPRAAPAGRRSARPLLLALAALLLSCACCVVWDRRGLPAPRAATAAPSAFSEARVLRHVDALCAGGPRETGSAAEAAAFAYAAGRFAAAAAAAQAAGRGVRVEVDRRVGSGGMRYVGGPGAKPRLPAARGGPAAEELPAEGVLWSDALYSDLDVLVARVTPPGHAAGRPSSSLLLSVHVDTQWNTEGATDNSVHVATLLELLDAVVAGDPPGAPLLFLLQSGEEDGLLGAHAFVTTHPWAADVAAFVNLEAMGAGGRPLLFQATPRAAWMLQALAAVAPPGVTASAVGSDMFSSGFTASDTDLRVFRDHGGWQGIDIAYLRNGHAYHTRLDDRAMLHRQPGAAQAVGDALLPLLRTTVPQPPDAVVGREAVLPPFYNILGRIVVHAPAPRFAAAPVVTMLLLKRRSALPAMLAVMLSWAAAPLSAAAFAVMIAPSSPFSFYSHPALAALLYVPPALVGALSVLTGAADMLRGAERSAASAGAAEAALLEGTALAWALLYAATSAAQLGSAFIPLYWALLPGLGLATAQLLFPASGGATLPLTLPLPAVLLSATALRLMDVVIGVAGRADPTLGGAAPWAADVLVAMPVGCMTAMAASYVVPMVVTRERALRAAMGCALACLLLGVAGARIAAPFDAEHPRPVMLVHLHEGGAGGASRVVLASLPATPLRPLADALTANFRGAAGARGRGATASASCHVVTAPSAPPPPPLVTANASAWCDITVGISAGEQALAAAGGVAPSLAFASPPGAAAMPRRRVVLLDAAGATRWALGVNPSAVERYAIAPGWDHAQQAEPPAHGAPGAPPLGWVLARAMPPAYPVRWPVVRHAGGRTAGSRFTLWLDVREAAAGEEPPRTLARLRTDRTVATPVYEAVLAALPREAATFGKASLPQALAMVAELSER